MTTKRVYKRDSSYYIDSLPYASLEDTSLWEIVNQHLVPKPGYDSVFADYFYAVLDAFVGDSLDVRGQSTFNDRSYFYDGAYFDLNNGTGYGIGINTAPNISYGIYALQRGNNSSTYRFQNSWAGGTNTLELRSDASDEVELKTLGSTAGYFSNDSATFSTLIPPYAKAGIFAQGTSLAVGTTNQSYGIDFIVGDNYVMKMGGDLKWYIEKDFMETTSESQETTSRIIILDTVSGRVKKTDYPPMERYQGQMSFSDSSVVLSVTQDTWTFVTNANNDLWTYRDNESFGFSYSGDTLYPDYSGTYLITGHLSFEGNNNESWKVAVIATDKVSDFQTSCAQMYTSSSDMHTLPINALLNVTSGSQGFVVKIYNSTDNDDPTITCGALIAVRINNQ